MTFWSWLGTHVPIISRNTHTDFQILEGVQIRRINIAMMLSLLPSELNCFQEGHATAIVWDAVQKPVFSPCLRPGHYIDTRGDGTVFQILAMQGQRCYGQWLRWSTRYRFFVAASDTKLFGFLSCTQDVIPRPILYIEQ